MTVPILDRSITDPACLDLRRRAERDGVNCADNLPFLLGPEHAENAVLLVHGFTASPWEMRLVAEYLASHGLAALAVRLPGHGTSPQDLARQRWEEWLEAVHYGCQILRGKHERLFALGMSTGCLLLIADALQNRYDGLILCAPYLRIRHRLAGYAGWLCWLLPYHGKAGTSACQHYYDRRPVAGVHQINRLIGFLRPRLGGCTAPTLAFNSEGDRTIVNETGRELIGRLGSRLKTHICYGPEVPHMLVREENRLHLEMFQLIGTFIAELSHPGNRLPPGYNKGG